MFKAGEKVGPIQPYFLSQIDSSLNAHSKLGEGELKRKAEAQGVETARMLADFVGGAKNRLDIAIYDFRLPPGEAHDTFVGAINEAAKRGVSVRIAYDKDQEDHTPGTVDDFVGADSDPAPDGTNQFVESQAFDARVGRRGIATAGIDPEHHIMHHKYILRDAKTTRASLMMGSANFTLDAWAAQENNMLVIDAVPDLVAMYENDFGELWTTGTIHSTGVDDSGAFNLGGIDTSVAFAPGRGTQVEGKIADVISGATDRLYIASMLISSGKILEAVGRALRDVQEFGGIYDEGEMNGVVHAWERAGQKARGAPTHPRRSASLAKFSSQAKLALWNDIKDHFVAKHSIKYADNVPHNFLHDKVAVVDDTVITGSFNFSNNAMKNAENILVIQSRELADQYVAYIQGLLTRYGGAA